MLARVKKATFSPDRRVIMVSDIHANLPLFRALLRRCDYDPQSDTLVLVGDLVQRKPYSIDTLRYIMRLAQNPHVHAMIGNNDQFVLDLLNDAPRELFLKRARLPGTNMLGEMCAALAIDTPDDMDVGAARAAVKAAFAAELDWLGALPHIIDTPHMYFAHAGLDTEDLCAHDAHTAIKNDAFFDRCGAFTKPLVVGHWPTVLSCRGLLCLNPLIDLNRNVIAIDGGNAVKGASGQLNALIAQRPESRAFSFVCVDELPFARVTRGQRAGGGCCNIVWGNNRITVERTGDDFSLCRHIGSGNSMMIPNDFIQSDADGYFTYDCTDYMLPVEPGEAVRLIKAFPGRYLAKKCGVIGWVEGAPGDITEGGHDLLS